MTSTTTAAKTCTKPQAAAGFTLPCPLCGTEEASIALNLAYLDDDTSAVRCNECDTEFGLETVRNFIRRWAKVLAWVSQAPAFADDE